MDLFLKAVSCYSISNIPVLTGPRSWELTSALTNIRISIDPRTMRELKMGVKWSGETVTAVLE